MRRSLLVAAGTALLCLTPVAALAATAAPKPAPATVHTVVRPVNTHGHAVQGWVVDAPGNGSPLDCSGPYASVAAVDKNILQCAPDAAYAVACWPAARAHHVLCLDDARSHQLVKLRTKGRIAHPKPLKHRAPLQLTLANGVHCGIRDGGAATNLKQHPSWLVTYYCTHNRAVWVSPQRTDFGVHRGGPAWTVDVANANGKHDIHTQRVTRAWFVGTA
ncbi:hypothetical protein [Jatrophihabitans endophyticus]|uniref:hypothetical protein n=1 Tax=Jatrophihabitans endophyticus TaxID=1206085 RepID=UPI0019F79826|nr:hypothetical protein [Jatrophihabitans endophyticus]MBE7189971.1 hypothetical protein [Jatrophihabitans endophyticus]